MENKEVKWVQAILFGVYIFLLVWIILLKMGVSIGELDHIRSINLIPFHYDNETNTAYHVREVVENVLVFVPFGIYLSMIVTKMPAWKRILLMGGVSLGLEVMQYVLAVGCSDITDVITNTCGGALGVGFYWLLLKMFKNKRVVDGVITALAGVATVAFVGLVSVILIANR